MCLVLDKDESLGIHAFWGGDLGHDLGTDNVFYYWRGRWVSYDRQAAGKGILPEDRWVNASQEKIVNFFRSRLIMSDFKDSTVEAFLASGVLQSVLRDAPSHALVLSVMGS